MKIIDRFSEWFELRKKIGANTLGFVPTMGSLHEGHLQLLRQSVEENDVTVLSVFVNPTQFNNLEDFQNYPKNLGKDVGLARSVNADYLFLPSYEELYPDDYTYRIHESSFSSIMEGAFRPGHFDGMLTVVMKLLMLVKADRAYFGEKDYQQLQLVRGLVQAFFLDTEIIGCPTLRDAEGLALSSRNSRLTAGELIAAAAFPALLADVELSDAAVREKLEALGFHVDYVETHEDRRFGAIHVGDVRLIDNVFVLRDGE